MEQTVETCWIEPEFTVHMHFSRHYYSHKTMASGKTLTARFFSMDTSSALNSGYDQGFSWVVAISCFLACMVTDINIVSFGVLLTDLSEHFGMGMALLSLLAAVRTGLLYFTGMFCGGLVDRFGSRAVCMVGFILASLGYVIGAFIHSFGVLIATFGVITGVGAGMSYTPPAVIIQKHFLKKRALATAFTSAGFSIGSTSFGLSGGYIIEALGWRRTLVVLGALNLQVVVAAAFFFEPVRGKGMGRYSMEVSGDGGQRKYDAEVTSVEEEHNQIKVVFESEKANSSSALSSAAKSKGCACNSIKCLDFGVLRDKPLALFVASMFPSSAATIAYFVLGPNRAYVQGVSKVASSYITSALGFSAFIGRLSCGLIGQKKVLPSFVLYGVASLACGAIAVLSVFAGRSLALHLIFATLFGFCQGHLSALVPIVCVDLIGTDLLPHAYSWSQGARGICVFTFIPLAGWLRDYSGGYLIPFITLGLIQILGVIAVLIGYIKLLKLGLNKSC